MLNCKETTELISRSMDERLSLRQRLGVRLHIFYCAMCRRYEQHLRFLRMATRRLASGDLFDNTGAKLSPQTAQRIRDALDHRSDKKKRP